jgi:multiple sugar transport system substrate-binding protein
VTPSSFPKRGEKTAHENRSKQTKARILNNNQENSQGQRLLRAHWSSGAILVAFPPATQMTKLFLIITAEPFLSSSTDADVAMLDHFPTRAVFIAVLVVILLFILFGWPGLLNKSLPSATKVYFADNISAAHRRVIERFNEKHAGAIEVVPVNLPFDKFSTNERKELIARSLRNKSDRLDMFAVDQIWVPRFSKWSAPLGSYFSGTEREHILAYALESCYFDSTLFAIPLYIDVGMMYYRRDLVRKLSDGREIEERIRNSITWEEFIRLKQRLAPGAGPFYTFQANDYEGLVCNYFELIAGQDPGFFAGHAVDLHSPAAQSALQMMVDFVHRYGLSPSRVTEFDENRSYAYMLDRDGMFVRGWPNFLENFRTFYPDSAKLRNMERAPLPHFRGKKPAAVFGGWNLMISKDSPSLPEAVEFLRFLQSEEAQKLMFEVGGYLPSNNDVYQDSSYMRRHPDLVYYRKLLDSGFHRPSLVEYTKMSDIISHFVHLAIKGELPAGKALNQADAMIVANEVLIK